MFHESRLARFYFKAFIVEYGRREFCIMIKHCQFVGKNTTEAKLWLDKHYPRSALSKSTVCSWYKEIKFGLTSTTDAENVRDAQKRQFVKKM